MIDVEPHPLLDFYAFTTDLPRPLGEMGSETELTALLSLMPKAPMQSSDAVRDQVRNLLRHGGFRPTGRSKPAAEYLIKAAQEGMLKPINLAVDACNAVSLHSGLPISVVDLGKATPPFRIAIAPTGASYVFNASGQTIDLAGLICLFDAAGPCANAVKDAQSTKTDEQTRRTLSVIWGTTSLPGRAKEAARWYQELLNQPGATTSAV